MTTTRAAAGSMLFQAAAHATGAPGPAAPGSEGLSLRSLTFCNLRHAQGDSLGVRCDKSILDVGKAGRALRIPVPTSVDEVLEGKALAGLQKVLASPAPSVSGALVPVDEARFSPCISRPQTILMLGNALSPHGG
ncbi:MAG TPA: hypothetical protein VLQ79_10525, partial [Myxococcaceae bacterium]|nr:hypothetical protein [Myxococcaceae bacterium]